MRIMAHQLTERDRRSATGSLGPSASLSLDRSGTGDGQSSRTTGGSSAPVSHGLSDSGDWTAVMEDNWRRSQLVDLNPWNLYVTFRRARIITVEPVIFLFMFGTYLYLSVTEQYFLNRFGQEKLKKSTFPWPEGTFCVSSNELDDYANASDSVQSESAALFLYSSLPNQLISVVVTLLLGPLSDRFGRKPFIFFASVGATLNGFGTLLIIHYEFNMNYFIAVTVITAFFGGYATILTVSLAYLTDISSRKWITFRIGALEAMIFAGGALGQGFGGLWLDAVNCNFEPLMIMYIASAAAISVYTLILLPASTSQLQRLAKVKKRPHCIKNLLQGLKLFFCSRWAIGWRLWAALIAACVVVINVVGNAEITTFFLKNHPLNWGARTIGFYQFTHQVSHMVALLFVLPILVALRFPDPLIAFIGLVFSFGMYLLTGFVRITWEMFIVGVFSAPEAMIPPTMRAIMSKLVPITNQGALFACIAAMEVLSSALGTGLYNGIYGSSQSHDLSSGDAYIVMAALCVIPAPLIILLLIFRKLPQPSPLVIEGGPSEQVPDEPESVSDGLEPGEQGSETDWLLPRGPSTPAVVTYDSTSSVN